MSSIWTDHESAAQDPFDPTSGLDAAPSEHPDADGPRRAWGGAGEPAAAAEEVAEEEVGSDVAPAEGAERPDGADRVGPGHRAEDGSYGDPTGAVHVRLAEGDLRVVGVRVSTRWRERLRRTDLATALRTACHRAQVEVPRRPPAPGPAPVRPATARTAAGARTIDWAGFNRLLETTRTLSEEAAARRSRPEAERTVPRLTTPLAEGEAAAGRVRVVLAPTGQVREVEIDPQWADQSRITELSAALETALAAAYDAWQPPRYDLGEAGRLLERVGGHRDQLLDLIAGRR